MTIPPLTKILDILEWRGPSGRAMGYVVLKRTEAQELLRNFSIELNRLQAEEHEVVITREERLQQLQAINEETGGPK